MHGPRFLSVLSLALLSAAGCSDNDDASEATDGSGLTTTTTGAPVECTPADANAPHISPYSLAHVPHGYSPTPWKATTPLFNHPSGEVDDSRSVLALVHTDGARIEVVVLTSDDPGLAVSAEHRGTPTSAADVLRCLPGETGDESVVVRGEKSLTNDRVVVGTREFEYGSVAVVGSGGASLGDVVATFEGLRLVGD